MDKDLVEDDEDVARALDTEPDCEAADLELRNDGEKALLRQLLVAGTNRKMRLLRGKIIAAAVGNDVRLYKMLFMGWL